jgi:hypothetical protein
MGEERILCSPPKKQQSLPPKRMNDPKDNPQIYAELLMKEAELSCINLHLGIACEGKAVSPLRSINRAMYAQEHGAACVRMENSTLVCGVI